MRTHPSFWQGIQVAAGAALIVCLAPACKPAAKPAGPGKPAAVRIAATPVVNMTATAAPSVFEQLMPPKGRDPFFPTSHRRDPELPKGATPDKPAPAPEIVLRGVVGSTNHRLALINDNTILGVGEEGAVRVSGGHLKLRCLEIGEDYAVIQVEGEVQTKRLQLNKKGL